MASDYYNDYGGRPAKRRRSLFMGLLDLILTIATVAAAVTTVLTYCVPYVDPARIWFFPVLGLAAPGIYVASVVLMLYWVIRWRKVRALVMLAVVVAGLFKVSLFWRPEIRRSYDGEAVYDRGAFRVMTYNVRSFYGENGGSSVDDILQLIAGQDPDIICLQEFNARPRGALRGVRAARREIRERPFRTHAGPRFGLRCDDGHSEQIPHPADPVRC